MFFQTNPRRPIIVSSPNSIIPVAFSPSAVGTVLFKYCNCFDWVKIVPVHTYVVMWERR